MKKRKCSGSVRVDNRYTYISIPLFQTIFISAVVFLCINRYFLQSIFLSYVSVLQPEAQVFSPTSVAEIKKCLFQCHVAHLKSLQR